MHHFLITLIHHCADDLSVYGKSGGKRPSVNENRGVAARSYRIVSYRICDFAPTFFQPSEANTFDDVLGVVFPFRAEISMPKFFSSQRTREK